MLHPTFRTKLYFIIQREHKKVNDTWSEIYDWVMMILIVASIIPLLFSKSNPVFHVIEWITVIAFIIDYFARWFTYPVYFEKNNRAKKRHLKNFKGFVNEGKDREYFEGNQLKHLRGLYYKEKIKLWWKSLSPFIRYPFTYMAIVDLLSILPGINLINENFKLCKLFRLFRLFRLIRLIEYTEYADKIKLLLKVLKENRKVLFSALILAMLYIFVTAVIMYNSEPSARNAVGDDIVFHTFFDALYWSTVTLTSIGYGDFYPITDVGKAIVIISSLFGIAIIAMPAAVVTAAYMEELKQNTDKDLSFEKTVKDQLERITKLLKENKNF